MPTGTVKWFNNAKGYGFILPNDGGEDLFAHYSAIRMDGYKTLKAGQEVSFDVTKGDKGLHATAITPLGNQTGKPDDATGDTSGHNGSGSNSHQAQSEPLAAASASH